MEHGALRGTRNALSHRWHQTASVCAYVHFPFGCAMHAHASLGGTPTRRHNGSIGPAAAATATATAAAAPSAAPAVEVSRPPADARALSCCIKMEHPWARSPTPSGGRPHRRCTLYGWDGQNHTCIAVLAMAELWPCLAWGRRPQRSLPAVADGALLLPQLLLPPGRPAASWCRAGRSTASW